MRRVILFASVLAAAAMAAAVDDPVPAPQPAEAQAPSEAAPPQPMPADPVPATPEPAPADTPAPAPAPVVIPSPEAPPTPILPMLPPLDFVSPHQGVFDPVMPVLPAHRLAMMEANNAVLETDPLVAQAATMLSALTARYIEDAPRIADLTIKTCKAIRAKNQAASPLEFLDGALKWKRPASYGGNVPRRFEGYAAHYRKLRLEQGKDHAAALSLIQEGSASMEKGR